MLPNSTGNHALNDPITTHHKNKAVPSGTAAQRGGKDLLRRLFRGALEAVLPQDCAVCAAPTDGRPTAGGQVCAACELQLASPAAHCPRCALPSPNGGLCGACIRRAPHFDRTIAAATYAFPLDRLIQAYKYEAALAYAGLFTELLARALGPIVDVDLVVPMPLHPDKIRARGFNQAHELARRIAPRYGVPVDPFAAVRAKPTTVQADLPIEARASNVRNAFAASAAVLGRRIAVVDDVMTTGATLDELARTLKAHGALHVENWVVARALLSP